MNSEKIDELVESIFRAKTSEEYDKIVDKLSSLCGLINDTDFKILSDSKIKESYKQIIEYFDCTSDPRTIKNALVKKLNEELKKSNDVFNTYKICYALGYMFEEVKADSPNIRFVKGILKKHDYNGNYFFSSMQMLAGIYL